MNASNPTSDESRLRLAGLVDAAMDAIITIDEAQNGRDRKKKAKKGSG